MYEATENSQLVCNSYFQEIVFSYPSYRDFKGPEQFLFKNAELIPNPSEHKKIQLSTLLPSAPPPKGIPHAYQHNLPYRKNYKLYGTSKRELEKVMNKYLQFNGLITSLELSGQLREGGYLVSKDTNSNEWQHCIGLMVLSNGLEYFDPTGNKPTVFNSEFKYTNINNVKLQLDQNMTCGPHSCFYLTGRFHDSSMSDIIQRYPSQNGGSLADNDIFINNFFNTAYVNSLKIVHE